MTVIDEPFYLLTLFMSTHKLHTRQFAWCMEEESIVFEWI